MLRSANGGSVALAEHIGGTEQNFAKLVNIKAGDRAINTNFCMPT